MTTINNIFVFFLIAFIGNSAIAACPNGGDIITTDYTVNAGESCIATGTLTMNKNGKTLTIDGDLEVTGAFTLSKGTVIVNGSLTIGGTLTMASNTTFIVNGELVMDNGGSIAANGTFTINGPVYLNGGDLDVASGNTTGISATSNGAIINNGGGTIDGVIIDVLPGTDSCDPNDGSGVCCGDPSACNSALPVELTAFNVTRKDQGTVIITWTTAAEIDNSGFYVEKSTDNGKSFSPIAFIKGNGTTKIEQKYSYVDYASHDIVAYRLKQVDFDGQFEYSGLIITRGSEQEELVVSPNPTRDGQVRLLGVSNIVSFTLSDMYGNNLINGNTVDILNAEGQISDVINRTNLKYYILSVHDGASVKTKKIIKL